MTGNIASSGIVCCTNQTFDFIIHIHPTHHASMLHNFGILRTGHQVEIAKMSMKVLTSSEKLLLSSVGIFATSLTLIVIFCVVKKNCWLHKIIWNDDKKKKHKLDDMICIRYPPDIYPPSIGIYREITRRVYDSGTSFHL
ncbi:hypothetical protein Ocin01_15211 [Orchesella cincta]|uniref:Uncharacterized protein n=1 Tax=Orchesella cincta TaxID=48709 RepID=A0A1D2MEV5_ORCCI|nr:hypothetical protein Ocin01_15211 [Orchesella cincta]